MSDPRIQFPQFYDNVAIRTLAPAARWTISGQLGQGDPDDPTKPPKRKAPIDARHLIDFGRLRGAWSTDENCLVTLAELCDRFPNAANNAFALQSHVDGLVVIDIEPDCPPEVSAELLALPDDEIVYRELSMSGRGFHLMAPLPANFHDHPLAAGKRVLRQQHGWYEILLEHWITLTRRPIPAHTLASSARAARSLRPFRTVAELYESLALHVRADVQASPTSIRTDVTMPDIRGGSTIIEETLTAARPRLKTLSAFNGDHSRWEFSTLAVLYACMRGPLMAQADMRTTTYTTGDEAWLLFMAAHAVIPPRPKHNERRNGRPFLLDRAASLIARRQAGSESGRV